MDDKVNPTRYENTPQQQQQQMAHPPPSYTEAAAAPMQPPPGIGSGVYPVPQQQPMILNPTVVYTVEQQAVPATTIIVCNDVKIAPSFDPYLEYCPRCRVNVVTNTQYVMGFCSWLMFFLGLFLFFPLLYCFCLRGFKDARHFCPNCGSLIAIKRR